MILKLFLFWRMGLFFLTYLASAVFPKVANTGIGAVGPGKTFDFWASWAQWDGGYYLNIAQNGYSSPEQFAFFPLYPMFIKFLSKILFGNLLLAGLLVSNISLFIFLLLFHKLLEEIYSKKIATSTIITFLFFPTTFFLGAVYSEAIFLLLVILIFRALRKNDYKIVFLSSILLTLTRPLGFFVFFAQIYAYLAKIEFKFTKIKANVVYLCAPAVTFVVYCLYLKTRYGDPFKFFTAEAHWQRKFVGPISTFNSYVVDIFTMKHRPINDFFDILFTVAFFIILILGRRKIPSSWWIFSALAILIPASTGTLSSMPRYLLASFGVFVIIGIFLSQKKQFSTLFWIISLTFQLFLAIMFVNGYWVA